MLDIEKFHFNNTFFDNARQLGNIRLVQIGDRLSPAGAVIQAHKNVCFELTYIYSGEAKIIHDDKEFKLSKGEICLTKPEQMHSIKADYGEDLRYLFLGFELAEEHYLYEEFRNMLKINIGNMVVKDNFNICDYFIRALNEFVAPSAYSDQILWLNVEYMVTYYFKSLFPQSDAYGGTPKTSNEMLIYNIINYLDNNALSFNGNAELEQHFGYSISHISHTFSKVMGQTINHYVVRRKLGYAKRMLLSDKSITSIAEVLGYNSIHSFSKAFKNVFGMSPSEFRNRETSPKTVKNSE